MENSNNLQLHPIDKYYAPDNGPIWLTLTDHEGTLDDYDIMLNIVRMLIMSNEDLDAEEAILRLNDMPMNEYSELKDTAWKLLYEPEMQEYLHRKKIATSGSDATRLYPIRQRYTSPDEQPSDKEMWSYLIDELNEMNWNGFVLWEQPFTEWD